MLVIFKSKAAADIIMYEEHAKMILDLLSRDTKNGIIMADETAWAIDVLEKEVARRKEEEAREKQENEARERAEEEKKEREKERKKEMGERDDDDDDKVKDRERERESRNASVSFSARAYPFLEMLRAANRKNRDIVWGV